MTHCNMQHIPLSSAYLCQDCNSVGNCAMQCPACASIVLMGLAGVLNREHVEEAEIHSHRPASRRPVTRRLASRHHAMVA
jgi:hypothetical protein